MRLPWIDKTPEKCENARVGTVAGDSTKLGPTMS
jgi:hypothetical protein